MAEADYPRIYRYTGAARTIWLTLELVLIIGGVAGGIAMQGGDIGISICGWLLAGPVALLGVVAMYSTLRSKLVLYADRAEYTGILAMRIIPTAEVKGRQNLKHKYGHAVVTIVMTSGRKIQITDFGKADAELNAWLKGFSNLDAALRAKRSRSLQGNKAFGATKEVRKAVIERDSAWIRRAVWASYGMTSWALFYPHPYVVCMAVMMAVPVACGLAALWSRGRWTLLNDKDAGRLSLSWVLGGPLLVLLLHAIRNGSLLELYLPLMVGLGVGAALTVVIVVVERSVHPTTIAWGLAGCCLYACASLLLLNALLDQAPPETAPVQIANMHVSTGKSTSYELYLTPWGPYGRDHAYEVSSVLYRSVRIGDTICIYRYPGAFGWPHINIDRCPPV